MARRHQESRAREHIPEDKNRQKRNLRTANREAERLRCGAEVLVSDLSYRLKTTRTRELSSHAPALPRYPRVSFDLSTTKVVKSFLLGKLPPVRWRHANRQTEELCAGRYIHVCVVREEKKFVT